MIEISALRKDFVVNRKGETKRVLDIESFAIKKGEFVALLGPSGCGKTTLLRIIAGLESATAGRLLYEGKDLAEVPVQERPFHTVFQRYALFPHLSVFENVAFPLRLRKIAEEEIRRRVGETLELVRLQDFAHRRPESLSGGQSQRVAVARALVNRPVLLLLDEPFSALDSRLRVSMQTELRQLQRELGITFLMVTHDRGEAFSLSDRVAVMREGSIRQYDAPEEIYAHPADLDVAGISGDVFELGIEGRGRIEGGEAVFSVATIESAGVKAPARFEVRGRWRGGPVGELTRARLFARPENLRVIAAGGEAALPVNVVDSTFGGEKRTLLVAPRTLPRATFRIPVPAAPAAQLGAAFLSFPPDRSFLFPADTP